MFKQGDIVSYGTTGVCKIDGEMENKVKGEIKKYLVLKPVYQENSKVFVPMDNEELKDRMKPLLTAEEINELIENMQDDDTQWILNDNERAGIFKDAIKGGDREKLVKMVRVLYLHRKTQLEKGRKLHASDEHYLKDAEKLLFDEFALVLGIDPDEVVGFIDKKLGIDK